MILCDLCGSLRLRTRNFKFFGLEAMVRAKTQRTAKIAKSVGAPKEDLGWRCNDLLAIDAQIVVTQILVRI